MPALPTSPANVKYPLSKTVVRLLEIPIGEDEDPDPLNLTNALAKLLKESELNGIRSLLHAMLPDYLMVSLLSASPILLILRSTQLSCFSTTKSQKCLYLGHMALLFVVR
jgi:hypothetical protein